MAEGDRQADAVNRLESRGWEFSNWISAHDPARPEATVAVLIKRPRRGTTIYCEVEPDGTVIGE